MVGHLTNGSWKMNFGRHMENEYKFLVVHYSTIEIVWQPKGILITIGFTSIETTTFLVAHELTLSTQNDLLLKLTLGWPTLTPY